MLKSLVAEVKLCTLKTCQLFNWPGLQARIWIRIQNDLKDPDPDKIIPDPQHCYFDRGQISLQKLSSFKLSGC
jgi:hypothetical protein